MLRSRAAIPPGNADTKNDAASGASSASTSHPTSNANTAAIGPGLLFKKGKGASWRTSLKKMSNSKNNNNANVMNIVIGTLLSLALILTTATYLFPAQLEKVETEAQREADLYLHLGHGDHHDNDHHREEQDNLNNNNNNIPPLADMPSQWVDGEKKLKRELAILALRQAQGQDIGVPVLTRWLGDDIPAWPTRHAPNSIMTETEWQQKVEAAYEQMRKDEEVWRAEMTQYLQSEAPPHERPAIATHNPGRGGIAAQLRAPREKSKATPLVSINWRLLRPGPRRPRRDPRSIPHSPARSFANNIRSRHGDFPARPPACVIMKVSDRTSVLSGPLKQKGFQESSVRAVGLYTASVIGPGGTKKLILSIVKDPNRIFAPETKFDYDFGEKGSGLETISTASLYHTAGSIDVIYLLLQAVHKPVLESGDVSIF